MRKMVVVGALAALVAAVGTSPAEAKGLKLPAPLVTAPAALNPLVSAVLGPGEGVSRVANVVGSVLGAAGVCQYDADAQGPMDSATTICGAGAVTCSATSYGDQYSSYGNATCALAAGSIAISCQLRSDDWQGDSFIDACDLGSLGSVGCQGNSTSFFPRETACSVASISGREQYASNGAKQLTFTAGDLTFTCSSTGETYEIPDDCTTS